MVKSGQVPDAKSYEKLRSILDVKTARMKTDKKAILSFINSKNGIVKSQEEMKERRVLEEQA